MKNFQNPSISIAKRSIGIDFPPYVIAEMSANHNGKIENAFKIIDEAKKMVLMLLKSKPIHQIQLL